MKILIDGQTFGVAEIHRGIGIYTKNVISQMLKMDYSIEWYITLSDEQSLSELEPWVRQKLHAIVASEFIPGVDYQRNKEYTQKIQKIVSQEYIDLFWIPNPLMVNVLFLEQKLVGCKVVATIYDIIPYIFPIKEWSKAIDNEYQRRLKFIQKNIDTLLMISNATKKDWEEHVGSCEEKAIVTPLAADAKRFYCEREVEKQKEPYILFTGGFDYRKNINGALDAFALARRNNQEDEDFQKYSLIIVGNCDVETRKKYESILYEKKLFNCVKFTGYISDEELNTLYHNADIFFFPSLYEGFGLPILEAMLSGNYIVSADNSSLPEVCGGHATLFNANSTVEAAKALYAGYKRHKQESLEEIHARQAYAKEYTWDKTAIKTLESMDISKNKEINDVSDRPTLAIFTPWPDQKTGIADYVYRLIPFLSKYFSISVFTETTKIKKVQLLPNIPVYDILEFDGQREQYQYKLFEIGNNVDYHKSIYELFEQEGGIAEIHDFVLTPFFYIGYYKQNERDKFAKLLYKAYGEKGKKLYQLTVQSGNHPDAQQYPMVESVVNQAEIVFFHNHWSVERLDSNKKAFVIPLGAYESPVLEAEEKKYRIDRLNQLFDLQPKQIVIGCFGWVNPNKRPAIILSAAKILLEKKLDFKFIFWGENNDESLRRKIKEEKLQNVVKISGYIKSEDYVTALERTDIVINLRYPSMGESSATLCEAFKMGKPVIVSEVNQYREFPDEVCWKLPVCRKENELLAEYINFLVEHPDVRQALGENAQAYADNVLNPEIIARMYYNYIVQQGQREA